MTILVNPRGLYFRSSIVSFVPVEFTNISTELVGARSYKRDNYINFSFFKKIMITNIEEHFRREVDLRVANKNNIYSANPIGHACYIILFMNLE